MCCHIVAETGKRRRGSGGYGVEEPLTYTMVSLVTNSRRVFHFNARTAPAAVGTGYPEGGAVHQ